MDIRMKSSQLFLKGTDFTRNKRSGDLRFKGTIKNNRDFGGKQLRICCWLHRETS